MVACEENLNQDLRRDLGIKPKALKPRRIGRNARLLCPVCRNADKLSNGQQLSELETISLACGHLRELALPPTEGFVGVEDIIFNTTLAAKLFPMLALEEYDARTN